jgi:predicted RNase H-like HicB family nuclease
MPCKIEFLVDIVVEPDESEFLAYCPALKGLHVGGATAQEAMENAKDAIACHLTSMMKHGDPIPKDVLRLLVPRPLSRDKMTTAFA